MMSFLLFFTLPFQIKAYDEEEGTPIVNQATESEYNYLVYELGFDSDYINILPHDRIEYLVENAGPVEKESIYYKTYEAIKNTTGFSKLAKMEDPLVGTTVELTEEEYYSELENDKISTLATDIDGRYETSYKHMNVERSKTDSTTSHYVYEMYWDKLPSRRDVDYFSFVNGAYDSYCDNYYSAQLFSTTTTGSYTSTTSTYSNSGTTDHVEHLGSAELQSIAESYSTPRTARYDLVNSAKAIKLIHSFDVHNLSSRIMVSGVYFHNIAGSFTTKQLSFRAEKSSAGRPTVAIHNVGNGSSNETVTLTHYTRQTWTLASL